MTRRRALFQTDRVFIAAALLAAHGSYLTVGFRQKDLKFFYELFSAWTREFLHGHASGVMNMQIARIVQTYVARRLAKSVQKGRSPRYVLTCSGVLEATRTLASDLISTHLDEVFFVLYFIKNYGQKIESIVRDAREPLPPSMAEEVRTLLDLEGLKRTLVLKLDKQIKQFEITIQEAAASAALARKTLSQREDLADVAKALQANYPYQLNAQRPLQELYPELPKDLAQWELLEGPKSRSMDMWQPLRKLLVFQRDLIQNWK